MYSFDTHFCKLRTMSGELHRQGIEVILDMVFNHTAEGALGWGSKGFIERPSWSKEHRKAIWMTTPHLHAGEIENA